MQRYPDERGQEHKDTEAQIFGRVARGGKGSEGDSGSEHNRILQYGI